MGKETLDEKIARLEREMKIGSAASIAGESVADEAPPPPKRPVTDRDEVRGPLYTVYQQIPTGFGSVYPASSCSPEIASYWHRRSGRGWQENSDGTFVWNDGQG